MKSKFAEIDCTPELNHVLRWVNDSYNGIAEKTPRGPPEVNQDQLETPKTRQEKNFVIKSSQRSRIGASQTSSTIKSLLKPYTNYQRPTSQSICSPTMSNPQKADQATTQSQNALASNLYTTSSFSNLSQTHSALHFFQNLVDYVGPGHNIHSKFEPMVRQHMSNSTQNRRKHLFDRFELLQSTQKILQQKENYFFENQKKDFDRKKIIDESQKALEREKVKFEQEKADFERKLTRFEALGPEKAKFELEKADFERKFARFEALGPEKAKFEQEKADFEGKLARVGQEQEYVRYLEKSREEGLEEIGRLRGEAEEMGKR